MKRLRLMGYSAATALNACRDTESDRYQRAEPSATARCSRFLKTPGLSKIPGKSFAIAVRYRPGSPEPGEHSWAVARGCMSPRTLEGTSATTCCTVNPARSSNARLR
jgi:hypothetical protein